jgi:hypothetical protein
MAAWERFNVEGRSRVDKRQPESRRWKDDS